MLQSPPSRTQTASMSAITMQAAIELPNDTLSERCSPCMFSMSVMCIMPYHAGVAATNGHPEAFYQPPCTCQRGCQTAGTLPEQTFQIFLALQIVIALKSRVNVALRRPSPLQTASPSVPATTWITHVS
jgi:hypothetical protein